MPRPRRHLPKLSRRDHADLEASLRKAIVSWGAEGWALVGRPPHMRVAILVARKLANPLVPATTVRLPPRLGGGDLKVAIHALHRRAHAGAHPRTNGDGAALPGGAGTAYLAPGAPILWDDSQIGIGAVFSIGNKPFVITCGHVDTDETSLTTTDGQTEIATLDRNFFRQPDRLDAAVFAVTSDGVALFKKGFAAPTWCSTFHTPQASDNGEEVTFWPTAQSAEPPFVEDVVSYSACVPSGVGCGYVMLTRCTSPGDSGSLLQLGTSYYALASQRDGNNSFFTPLVAVKNRLESAGKVVGTWRPS